MKKRGLLYIPESIAEARSFLNGSPKLRDAINTESKELAQLISSDPKKTDFRRSSNDDIRDFFDEAAKDYDTDLLNPYWSFTHEILKFILRKFISEGFSADTKINLFDAGAGTGNWSNFILSLNDNVHATLFDINHTMLKVAHDKIKKHGHFRSKFMEGNLEKPSDLPMNDEFNLITCMHNVIGMARDTKAVLKNLASLLQTGGIAFIMAMNKYHALNFNLETGNEYEIQRTLCDGTIKFKEDMPEMLCYTPREFQSELEAAGFSRVVVLGYPVTVYPSSQDTKLQHFRTTEEMLKNPALRNQLLEVEKRLCINPELAYRGGSSLIAICGK